MHNSVERLGMKTKIGFGLGDLGFNIGVQATAIILIKFYTDTLLIGAGIAGTIVLVAKLIDAVTDPMMGIITDTTRSRWGKFRPYLLFGAIPFGLSFFLLLNAPISWDVQYRIAYAFITYIFFCIMLTITNVPYQSLLPVLTSSANERVSLSSYRSVGGIIGVLIASVAIGSLVKVFGAGDDVIGFRMTAGLFGLVIIGTTLICFLSTKEKFLAESEQKIPLKKSFALIFGNKPFLILCSGVLIIMTAVNTLAATIFFYFEYFLMNADAGSIALGAAFLAAIIIMPVFTKISQKTSNRFAYLLGVLIMCIGLLGIYFVNKTNTGISIAFLVIFGFGLAANYLCPWAMVANTIEYSQWKTGIRKEGTFYGVFFLIIKLSAALAGFIVGLILETGGYIPNLMDQSMSAQISIRMLATFIPIGLMLAGAFILLFYNITGKKHDQMVEEIKAKQNM